MPESQAAPRYVPTGPMLVILLSWYFLGHPRQIVRNMAMRVSALQGSFSFLFLLGTLFAPWKSLADDYPENMFDVAGMLSTFFFNTVTRGIGAMVRLGVIVFGLAAILVTLVGYILYLLFWIAFPLLFTGAFALSAFRALLP